MDDGGHAAAVLDEDFHMQLWVHCLEYAGRNVHAGHRAVLADDHERTSLAPFRDEIARGHIAIANIFCQCIFN